MNENLTDFLGLTKKEIFKVIGKCLPENVTDPHNIIECKDDILFVWNSKDCCVLSLNIQAATTDNGNDVKDQTLLCSNPPCIKTVFGIRASLGGAWLGIFSNTGVSLMELPRRWGPNGYYSGGRDTVTCRTLPVDNRYFSSGPLAALVQARWHPGSYTNSHLLLLTAENTMRLYDVDTTGVNLLQIWQIGTIPTAIPPTSSKLPYLTGLGDTAVDFDFLPPEVRIDNTTVHNSTIFTNYTISPNHSLSNASVNKSASSHVLEKGSDTSLSGDRKLVYWPVAVLNGCGDVFMVSGSFGSQKTEISKPFSMMPETPDNYGLDCCALLVLQSVPPTLVIASSKGVLHHCVLMSTELDDDRSFVEAEHKLYVLESVELQLGLNLKSSVAEEPFDCCPLRLHRDDIEPARYLVYHSAGVHAVIVPAVKQLQQFLELDDALDPELNPPALNIPCVAEYLLCTNISRCSKTLPKKSGQYTGVLGLTIFECPPTLITLLANGQVISLPLSSVPFGYSQPKTPSTSSRKDMPSPLKNMLKEPFDQHIACILKPKMTQPIMKLGDNVSAKQRYEVATKALKILREEYFTKLNEARQEIEKRIHALNLLKNQQLQEIKRLTEEKIEIKNRAEKIAEKCEDVHNKQESLTERVQMILRLASRRIPNITHSEREFFDKLKKIKIGANYNKAQIILARKNIEKQKRMIQQYESQDQKKDVYLSENRIEAIKLNLQERTAQITQLVEDIHIINNHLDLN